jgi:ribosomal subunit interface protein
MDIRIKATNYEITPEVSAYLDEKLVLVVEKMLGAEADTSRLEVEIARAAGNQRHGEHVWKVEVNLSTPGGPTVRATNHAENVNTAIDDVKEEVLRQLRTEKQVHRRILRRGGAAIKRLMRFGSED